MVSVGDLRDYIYCKRIPWFHRRLGIKKPNVGFSEGTKFHILVHSVAERIHRAFQLSIPGKLVDTEVTLIRENLVGRIDMIRQTEYGYIIQEEKFKNPPKDKRVYEVDKLQVDAYAYLAETSPYTPVISGIIVYNDLIPREVKLEPWRAKEVLEDVMRVLESDRLPNVRYEEKCSNCPYSPLCQVLPQMGGPTATAIKMLPKILEKATGLAEGYEDTFS